MKITSIRSDKIYEKMISAKLEERDDIYRYEIMVMRGTEPVGMPYCAGYACGYKLIKHYLKKTGKTIFEATITPTTDILKEVEDFWN